MVCTGHRLECGFSKAQISKLYAAWNVQMHLKLTDPKNCENNVLIVHSVLEGLSVKN